MRLRVGRIALPVFLFFFCLYDDVLILCWLSKIGCVVSGNAAMVINAALVLKHKESLSILLRNAEDERPAILAARARVL